MTPLLAAALVVGYLLGSIPFGLLLTRSGGAGDVRQIGSGSIGATNVLRTGRKGLAVATLILDMGKGAVAVAVGHWLAGEAGALGAGVYAVIGHIAPVWLRFRGGKGVATGLGVLFAAMPLIGVIAGLVWLIVAAVVRISSASSLAAFVAAPIAAWALGEPRIVIAAVLPITILIFIRHRANITRLLAGTEPRIGRGA